jgi:hypothetical protein
MLYFENEEQHATKKNLGLDVLWSDDTSSSAVATEYQQLIKIVGKFPKEPVIAGRDAGVSDLIGRVKCELRG